MVAVKNFANFMAEDRPATSSSTTEDIVNQEAIPFRYYSIQHHEAAILP